MFEPLIRWCRLKWLWADDLWFFLNRKRLKRDSDAFRAMMEKYAEKQGDAE